MWETPIYKLNQPFGTDEKGNHLYHEIVIDVTSSAPSFKEPGLELKKVLCNAIEIAKQPWQELIRALTEAVEVAKTTRSSKKLKELLAKAMEIAKAKRPGQELIKLLTKTIEIAKTEKHAKELKKVLTKAMEIAKESATEAMKTSNFNESECIIDFGGGKLRNALYLLEQGYKVCVVEYKEQFKKSKMAQENLKKAEGYGDRFSTLIYPHTFQKPSKAKFGLVLLINVVNIMPIPAERLLVLKCCHEKLRPGGFLLWLTQHGDKDYRKRMLPQFRVSDGYYIGRKTRYKTFYREYFVAEIDDLVSAAGFGLVSPVKAPWWNQARLYRALQEVPLTRSLTLQTVAESNVTDERIPDPKKLTPQVVASTKRRIKGNPNPPQLQKENLASKVLTQLSHGGGTAASEYQRHVKTMIEVLFPDELRGLTLEESVFGVKRIDILARNRSKSGFFFSLKTDYCFKCPWIVIECKNYNHDPKNPEFDQLGGRLGKKLGVVGILAYRRSRKRDQVIKRCKAYFNNEEKVLIPLADVDFLRMLKLKADKKEDEIENYLDRILLDVIR